MVLKLNKSLLAGSISLALFAPSLTYATNGMNLEGYGPIATGMGGASMAYDNGVAAVMNNPSTLGMMNDGESRLDLALGNLRPDITTSNANGDSDSSATSFLMPAVGWAKRDGQLTYGVGMFSQGGMGAEYDACSSVDPTCPNTGTGYVSRSEVGVGRLVAPLAFNVNENLIVGGSLDYVWGGMDLQMAMPGDATGFGDFIETSVGGGVFNGAHNAGIAQGSLVDGLANAMSGGAITGVNWVRFDFSNNSDFTGKATGDGFTGKLGLAYKVDSNLTIGASYHAKTSMSDLTTSGATVSMNVNADFGLLGGNASTGITNNATVPLTGKLTVNDFQFPAQFGLGMAFQQDKWLFVADVKVIKWSDVMDSFNMTFTADTVASNGAFGGAAFDVEMFQNWDDQTVILLGAAYQLNPETTLRAGINSSSNPIPKETLNHLFPATIENHYTFGIGYAVSQASNIDFSLALAPEVSVKAGSGNTVKHAQTNLQIQYSYKF